MALEVDSRSRLIFVPERVPFDLLMVCATGANKADLATTASMDMAEFGVKNLHVGSALLLL